MLASTDVVERATEIRNVYLNIDILPTQRVLGEEWNTESDTFSFRMSLMNKSTIRRGILLMVAAIYDPLEFLSPFTLLGKGILQEMCQRGMNWDEPLPKEMEPRWESWVKDLKNLEKIWISRCFKPGDFGKILRVKLHHFLGASSKGCDQCTYIELIGEDIGKAGVCTSRGCHDARIAAGCTCGLCCWEKHAKGSELMAAHTDLVFATNIQTLPISVTYTHLKNESLTPEVPNPFAMFPTNHP